MTMKTISMPTSTFPRLCALGAALVLAANIQAPAQSGSVEFTKIMDGDLVTDRNISASVVALDYDNDDDLDIFVANEAGRDNSLYRNDGEGVFTRGVENDVGSFVADGGDAEAVTAVDYDNDGDLDLYVANQGGVNFLYQNLGDGKFERLMDSGIATARTNDTYSTWGDVNKDGWLDVFIVNRYGADAFYWNRGDGQQQWHRSGLGSRDWLGDPAVSDRKGWDPLPCVLTG